MCEIGNKALQQNKLIALYGFFSNYNIFVHNSLYAWALIYYKIIRQTSLCSDF